MNPLRIGLVIIGDELLTGKRSDSHFPFAIEALKQRGLELSWVRMVGDERELLVQTFRETLEDGAVVFSFGGIGATPDDITRQCSAEAMGLPLELHTEGVKILEEQFGDRATSLRLRMVDFPVGAELIPNSVNRVPGYRINNHHFMPGFPSMSHPMFEWVLDTHYAEYCEMEAPVERRYNILNTPESDLIDIMESLLQRYPGLKISCLPSTKRRGSLIDLGLKGMADMVVNVEREFESYLNDHGIEFNHLDTSSS